MRLFAVVGVALMCLSGCVIKDTIEEGTRESRGGLKSLVVAPTGDGGQVVSFTFGYLIGIVDSEGIAPVEWTYSLRVPRGRTLFTLDQPMRDPQPDKTEILVVGERIREFEVPAGFMEPGQTYVLWFELYYRGERLGEFLEPVRVMDGEQVDEPFDPDQEI